MNIWRMMPVPIGRKPARLNFIAIAVVVALSMASVRPVAAVSIPFTLIPNSSSLAAAFDLTALGSAVTAAAQKPNSLTSKYSGTIQTNVFPASHGFPGGSNADAAQYSSTLSPAIGGLAGSAFADYGVRLTAPVGQPIPPIVIPNTGTINLGIFEAFLTDIALRNVVMDVTSPGTISRVAGAFDASQVSLLPSGSVDINLDIRIASPDFVTHFVNLTLLQTLASQSTFPISVVSSGNFFTGLKINISTGFTQPLDDLILANQATAGSLTQVGPNFNLTLPVDANAVPDFGGFGSLLGLNIHFTGNLVGTAPVVEIPEPPTWILSALAMVGLLVIRRRRSA